MKLNLANLGLIGAVYILAMGNSHAQAEVKPDGTLGTAVSPGSGSNSYNITGGTAVGNNLFHSFQQFSIPTGGSATFNTTSGIQNIFSRVTGGDVSYINGSIKTNSGVNLFLLNPAGIIFGDKARLNVGGSFIGTTANSIKFADGNEFSTNATISPVLTMSVPIGLQMGQNPAAIQVQASTIPLQVPTNKTLALVGGDVSISGRTLSTPQGRIELGAVDGGTVSLTSNNLGWSLGYQDVQNFRDITLSQQSLLSTGGNGEINIWGASLTLSGGSRVSVQNNTNVNKPGKISVHTSELLTVTGDNTSGNTTSAIRASAFGTGMVANIEIFTKDLIANNGGIILTNNSGTSVGGGNITVNASGTIQVAGVGKRPSNRSGISGLTFFSGKGGNVNVSTNKLVILDGAVVTTSTIFTGAAGNLTVNAAESIHVSGFETASTSFAPSSLSSSTLGAGNSGNLTVNTAKLSVHHGARVEASSYASGNAGNVILNASESVEVAGKPAQSFLIPSFIGSSTVQQAGSSRVLTGNSGDVHITTQQLRVADGGLVNVRNDGTGNAGKVGIDANFVMLDTQGAITATTQVGEGGNIIVNANTLLMRHNSAINATSGSVGNGGNITINAPIIFALENSDIVANAVQGRGGNIAITTHGVFGLKYSPQVTAESDITASSQFGVNGTVEVNNVGVDPNSGLIELPVNFSDPSQKIATGCADTSNSSFVATGRGGIPQNPTEELSSDRTWSDVRDISAFNTKQPVQAKMPKPQAVLVQATGWRRNAQGKIELIANQSPTQVQTALTCAATPQN
ncbi:filamentous hemagglutinin N-terminal domain-containing protein [Nostoc sp. FACHB-190]|uniref:two-partner secretion domain-containing protein n=1 Tax=Nostoc sp. FACHB-190 TaxID=2692838 RepID=UPI0016884E3B|nr:filamentous hemagglutinin N-terminal domain-containing protein [Nostoc sp. FACHB-190]MBD2299992.1 filamentous hemagglutinin N-terminal domain-containing protein [Nostoc sp. FACHB-190]